MTFLPETLYASLGPKRRAACDRQFADWLTLRDAVVPFIGEHATMLFCYAIAEESSAVATADYLRRALIETGENPDDPTVTEAEQALIDWGRSIARGPGEVSAEFQAQLEGTFTEPLRVMLSDFGAQTIAAHAFELDARASVGHR